MAQSIPETRMSETDRRPTPATPMEAPRPSFDGGEVPITVLEARLSAWDTHIDRCAECLVQGDSLCYEGEYLTERVVEAREMARTLAARASRAPIASLFGLGRTLLPGVGA